MQAQRMLLRRILTACRHPPSARRVPAALPGLPSRAAWPPPAYHFRHFCIPQDPSILLADRPEGFPTCTMFNGFMEVRKGSSTSERW